MYKRYVYEAEAMDRSEFGQHEVIKEVVMKKEQKKELRSRFGIEHITIQ